MNKIDYEDFRDFWKNKNDYMFGQYVSDSLIHLNELYYWNKPADLDDFDEFQYMVANYKN